MNSIELIPHREADLPGALPDYSIWAKGLHVGRIYQVNAGRMENWFWGLNAVTVDTAIGAPMHGYADSLPDAKAKLRAAFDRWLEWAQALTREDLRYPLVAVELMTMGFTKSQTPPTTPR